MSIKKIAGVVKKALTKDMTKNLSQKKKETPSLIIEDKTFQRIQQKAYEIYVARGCNHGNNLDDWYEAERMVAKEIKLKQK